MEALRSTQLFAQVSAESWRCWQGGRVRADSGRARYCLPAAVKRLIEVPGHRIEILDVAGLRAKTKQGSSVYAGRGQPAEAVERLILHT
jgi:hypothetical protein